VSTRRSIPAAAITAAALVFLFAPLVIVVLFSFHSTDALTPPFEGFSLRWYREVLDDRSIRESLGVSLKVATLTALATFLAGTAAAYGVTRSKSRSRGVLAALFVMPIALPGLILGVAMLSFFSSRGIALSRTTVVIAHSIFVAPVFFVIARTAFDRLDPAQLESAADLGAGAWYRLRRVTMPQILPVLLAATAMAFVISFDEFVVTFFVIGGESTLPMVVFSRLRRTIDPSINAISSLLLFFNLVLWCISLGVALRAERRRRLQFLAQKEDLV
jgi:ABC-type spermidine/putrescine transport system permease subunit II